MAEQVARAILDDIADQGLAPGTKLPSEVEMASEHGVARASLREGLRILEIHGLITIKPGPGGGPVVAAISGANLGTTLTFFLKASGATFRELMEARLALEPLMARLAAERGDRELGNKLKQGIEESRTALVAEVSEYLASAFEFHNIVTSGSGNIVLDLWARSLKEIYAARVRGIVYGPDERVKLVNDHERIAEAILSGDGELAERLMRDHMVEYVELVQEHLGGFMDDQIDWF